MCRCLTVHISTLSYHVMLLYFQPMMTTRWLHIGQYREAAMFEWAYVGVDHTLPGNGGQECVDFIPLWQRFAESGISCLFAACCLKFAYKRVTLPEKIPTALPDKGVDCGKRLLLVLMCLTFGIELGFKLATRQFIWIFNPCHVTSMIQVCCVNNI